MYERFCYERGLRIPTGVARRLRGEVGVALDQLVYWPDGDPRSLNSLEYGLTLLADSIHPAPENLLPLLPVDDRSIACAVCVEYGEEHRGRPSPVPTEVVRWHLDAIPKADQGALLDIDAGLYLESVAEELYARPAAVERIMFAADRYREKFSLAEKVRVPRSHDLRPIQLACQNVIIGLATIRQDAHIDSIRVGDFVVCEVPHLATYEATRAMIAVLLCDAFRNGGTMEVRFGSPGRDQKLPAVLSRYGRALGLSLGQADRYAITPEEARSLFLAVTPMPESLSMRCSTMLDRGLITPERLCYTLMSGVWSALELDYMFATSRRVTSILSGGNAPEQRLERLVENETCRAALMAGTLLRRLALSEDLIAGSKAIRLFEDAAKPIEWIVLEEHGAVVLHGSVGSLPWWRGQSSPVLDQDQTLIIVPRGLPYPTDCETLEDLGEKFPSAVVALLCPSDIAQVVPASYPMLIFPDRLTDLDVQIERRLLAMRLVRQ